MTLKSFVDSIFTPKAFDGAPLVAESSLGAALAAPEGTQTSQYLAWAETLPDRNPTSWLNLAESSAKAMASANGTFPFCLADRPQVPRWTFRVTRCRPKAPPKPPQDGFARRGRALRL